ncbi:alkaline phosphatase D family protein [Maricaulis sp.]|uniref:alkaline phosphatase D family protein n=1 Tax=Maricaulis sp. TaxID=1486257 RepID=UPI00261ACC47|nr:alkaline phosphatase D family protein [Maricaulis sp.]
MTKFDITRRGALWGAAGAGLAVSGCSSEPQIDAFVPPADGPFRHGVASGDPDQTSVMLWTALSNDGGGYRGVELARDEAFEDIVFEQGEEIAYITVQPLGTLKILADGLEPGERYFYRFRLNDQYSPVGVTRTLPEGAVAQYRIGVFSCSNFPAGHFNVYREAAENGALDLVLHLGDYIYEYGADGYASTNSVELNRVSEPVHEILSYQDYVARHAQYKTDPGLQALHAAAPWVMIWDDHETANDSWATGAENHDEGEGEWIARRDAALRAWYEWTPSREIDQPHTRRGVFEIGDLGTVAFLESRLSVRSPEIAMDSLPIDPNAEMTPENLALIADWKRDVVGDDQRELLGSQQIGEIRDAFGASVAAGKPWRIIANQVIMAKVDFPDFTQTMPGWLRWIATRNNDFARQFINSTRFEIPFGLDMWDGFPAERERLYAALREVDADIITVTGDVHSYWTNDLVDAQGHRLGSEFVTASVSSPSPFSSFAAPGVNYGDMFVETNPAVRHCNMRDHGYIRMTVTPEALDAEYVRVSDILSLDYEASVESAWRVTPAGNGREQVMERVG